MNLRKYSMSLFGNDDLAELKGFEKVLQQKVENQKAEFIRGYKISYNSKYTFQGLIVQAVSIIKYQSNLSATSYTRGHYSELYNNLGKEYGTLVKLLKLAITEYNNIKLSDEHPAISDGALEDVIRNGTTIAQILERIARDSPEEYLFIRVRLIKVINQQYGPEASKSSWLDEFMKPIMKQLAKEPKQA